MQPSIEKIGKAIIDGAFNPEAKDVAVDLGEIELGEIFSSDVLKEVPAIKSVLAIYKTFAGIKDQLFIRKVAAFLAGCSPLTDEEKNGFLLEHISDPKRAKKLSEALVLIIERLDDLEKPQMLAKVFSAFVRGRLDFETFRRLSSAIDIALMTDLKNFLEPELPADKWHRSHPKTITLRENLLRSGLTGIHRGTGTTPISGVSIVVTDLGKLFRQCMNEAFDQNETSN